jgi:hypothetical protein
MNSSRCSAPSRPPPHRRGSRRPSPRWAGASPVRRGVPAAAGRPAIRCGPGPPPTWAGGAPAAPPPPAAPVDRTCPACWRCGSGRCWPRPYAGCPRTHVRTCCWWTPPGGTTRTGPGSRSTSARCSRCRPWASPTGRCWPPGSGPRTRRTPPARCCSTVRWSATGCAPGRAAGRWPCTRAGVPVPTWRCGWCATWPGTAPRPRCARPGGWRGAPGPVTQPTWEGLGGR